MLFAHEEQHGGGLTVQTFIYQLTRILIALYFNLYHRLSIYGKETIPADRTVILAPNHASYLDPPVVGLAFYPRYLRFIAWDRLFKFAPMRYFLCQMGAVPVSQENKMSSAGLLRMVIGFLDEGNSVYIAPEGHRTYDGTLQPLEGGVAILSLKTGSPVVPTWVGGTYQALSRQMKFPRPRKITVTFGPAIDPKNLPETLSEKEKRELILSKIQVYYEMMDKKDREQYPRN